MFPAAGLQEGTPVYSAPAGTAKAIPIGRISTSDFSSLPNGTASWLTNTIGAHCSPCLCAPGEPKTISVIRGMLDAARVAVKLTYNGVTSPATFTLTLAERSLARSGHAHSFDTFARPATTDEVRALAAATSHRHRHQRILVTVSITACSLVIAFHIACALAPARVGTHEIRQFEISLSTYIDRRRAMAAIHLPRRAGFCK